MAKHLPLLNNIDIFALLENRKVSDIAYESHLFWNLQNFITCHETNSIKQALKKIDQAIAENFFVVGWFSYELGYVLEPKLTTLLNTLDSELFCVAVFKEHRCINQQEANIFLNSFPDDKYMPSFCYNFQLNVTQQHYNNIVKRIQNYLKEGDTYQVNYTAKYHFNYQGNPIKLYKILRDRQRVEYGAYLNFPNSKILSLSPELFFKKDQEKITAKPMKGTAPRGKSAEEDQQLIKDMRADEKTLAENVMIVDLLRNDIGKLAKPGTVNVASLFDIEKYETVLQMTSTINGEIAKDTSLYQIFKHIYPCGSITGTPKIRTMEIIHELETEPRGVYTGAIGFVLPGNTMSMNVPIRTIVLKDDNTAELGVGGAIIADSDNNNEYAEILLKGKFLTGIAADFALIETLLYHPVTGYHYMQEHLERLKASSALFNFNCPLSTIYDELIKLSKNMCATTNYKIRLILKQAGQFVITSSEMPIVENNNTYFIRFSPNKTYSRNILFQHKTTSTYVRDFYDNEYTIAKKNYNCDEVIFVNEKNQITEGSRTNLFIEKNNIFYTPPIQCGLLNGIMRQQFINNKNIKTVEKVLYQDDIYNADNIFLTNSVRGILPAKFHSE
jgi:para-aminobenzoate synthetase/4-amino-4-deoxychorismate lyase